MKRSFSTYLAAGALATTWLAGQATTGVTPTSSTAGTNTADPEIVSLSEFVVTGSSIRGQEVPVGSAMVSISRADVVGVAPQTTRDLIATIPQFGQFNVAPTASTFQSEAPNLRGLGQGATLTLLNGRRLAGYGILSTSTDPSVIPPSAVEGIQVIADGSSAVYGSDAVAGVVNVRTRTDLNGAEFNARAGFADSYETKNISLAVGKTWPSGSFMVAYEFAENSAIIGKDRDYVTNDLRSIGGADSRSTNAPQPNVYINNVPHAYPALLPNTINYEDTAKYAAIVPYNRRNSAIATLRQRLGSSVELFVDALYSKNLALSAFPLNSFNSVTLTINNTNPYFIPVPGSNATSYQVRYSLKDTFGESRPLINPYMGSAIAAGLTIKLPKDWSLELSGTYGLARGFQSQTVLNLAALQTAAVANTREAAFDPFTGLTNPAILRVVEDTSYIAGVKQDLQEATVKADGPLFTWAGGTVRAAIGAQGRIEWFAPYQRLGPNPTTPFSRVEVTRNVYGFFGELLVPLVAPNERAGMRRLDLSAAARYENYDSFGSTTNPKVGMNWEPLPGVLVRGSYGTSFKAPNLGSIQSVANSVNYLPNTLSPGNLTPPGAPAMNVINIIGGNPNLGPEEATTRSFGVDFVPQRFKGARLSVTYYTITYTNVVGNPTGRFTNPNLAFTYILNPTQAQVDSMTAGLGTAGLKFPASEAGILVDSRSQNLRSFDVEGLDYDVYQRFETQMGTFHANLGGTTYLNYETLAAPGVAPVDQLRSGTVKTKLRTALNWNRGNLGAGAAVNYTGTYYNANITPNQKVDPFVTVDLNATWALKSDNWLNNTTLRLNISNVLDEDPPTHIAGVGFNPGAASPIGRMFAISLNRSF